VNGEERSRGAKNEKEKSLVPAKNEKNINTRKTEHEEKGVEEGIPTTIKQEVVEYIVK
jgi:hypothetical protein